MRRQLRLDLSSNTSTIFHCLPSAYFCTGLMEVDFFFFSLWEKRKKYIQGLYFLLRKLSVLYMCINDYYIVNVHKFAGV